uniref:Uncharacterized protein K0039A02.8 n=1 Tax=Oryza sativa subsp. indica TaxID=39946 RepID=C8TEY6_ORYSI|nr:hypothetical protein [Oryza sativa Indica Group]
MVTALLGLAVEGLTGADFHGESGGNGCGRGELEIEDGRGGFEGGMGAGDMGEVELELAQKFGEKWGRGWRSGRQPRPHGQTCAREVGGGSFSGDVGRPGFPCGCRRSGWRKGEELTGGASGISSQDFGMARKKAGAGGLSD